MNNQEQIKKELDEFKKSLAGKSLDELRAIEQDVIKECEDVNNKVANTMYKLPKENYKIVAEAIRTFLNKETVQWQFTLAMVTIYDFWNPEKQPKEVSHPVLDQTLRSLGNLQFTGYEEWAMVIAINKYFDSLTKEFTANTQLIYDAASKHNIVMDEMGLNTPIKTPEQENK